MLEYQCPHCKTLLKIPEQFIGSTGTCRTCRKSITIEISPSGNGSKNSEAERPPTLIALHIESTGASSRKDNIVEFAAIKIAPDGRELDTYWTFANPDGPIPEKIIERTGITNDMVAAAPFPFEVVQEWFEWAGDNFIAFTDHGHYHAKFLCATLLREDIEPPTGRIIDVEAWAEQLEIRAPEYRLRPLLAAIGHAEVPNHRAMDCARGIASLAAHLIDLEAGRLPKQKDDSGVWNKLLGKHADDSPDPRLYRRLLEVATPLEEMCGARFHAREAFVERRRMKQSAGDGRNGGTPSPLVIHMPEWYDEKKKALEACMDSEDGDGRASLTEEDQAWTQALMAATKTEDPNDQRKHLMKAVTLGARDPWPYERLSGFFIKAKDYHSAQKVCQRYFEGDAWTVPRHADSSWRLLERLEKLERKIAGVS